MTARSPEEILQRLLEAMNAGATDDVAALYHDDAILIADPEHVVRGRAAIRDGIANLLAARPQFRLNAERVVRNGDVALLYSDWTIVLTRPGGQRVTVDTRPTVVARQQTDGAWLIVIDDPSVGEPAQTEQP